METDNYKIVTTSNTKSITVISEFFTNTEVSNFNTNFTYITTLKYFNTPQTTGTSYANFITSDGWAESINIPLSNNVYLSASSLYLIDVKNASNSLTKDGMYSYLLDAVFFNLKNKDIDIIINQYLIDFGEEVSLSLHKNFNVISQDSDILIYRKLAAECIGVRNESSNSVTTSI